MSLTPELYPLVFVDVALFRVDKERLEVLLVQRAKEPEIRRWGLPGGILRPTIDDSLEAAARRVLRDKVTVDLPHLEELRTFSGPKRDPRGWSISILFFALLPGDQVNAVVRSKVEAVEWVNPASPGHRMAFDHSAQLENALTALKDKVERRVLPLHLMPAKFTLTQLQRTCEAILGRPLDKSAFRRRLQRDKPVPVVELGELEPIRGAQRPAQLYRAREDFSFME
jgi:8-oxo-dGTP diphosphatase